MRCFIDVIFGHSFSSALVLLMRYLDIVWGPGYPREQVGAVFCPIFQRSLLSPGVAEICVNCFLFQLGLLIKLDILFWDVTEFHLKNPTPQGAAHTT